MQDGTWLGISKRTVFERRGITGYRLFTELSNDVPFPTDCVIAVTYSSKKPFTILAILLLHEGFNDPASIQSTYSSSFLQFADEVYVAYRNEKNCDIPKEIGEISINNKGHAQLLKAATTKTIDLEYRAKILEKIIQKLL
ncbi:hypothetical protein P261_02911 [Lachnospiraceae bacterium TWA4]|nr:hypothetical protein P261_02911 [Lachnospiraceae bacterium TWA4]